MRALLIPARQDKLGFRVMRDASRVCNMGMAPSCMPDGPVDIPIALAALFFFGLPGGYIDELLSRHRNGVVEGVRPVRRGYRGGLDEAHGHEDVHGDGVDAGSGIFALRHPSDRKQGPWDPSSH